ncbi:hypothetical protein GALL_537970 [mine drainage metagenome]|uniref:Uncharacterized protein n=1 Tax=mine drainage metagenome TaxID=410659 RepID=A0A1J5PB09_9ZZZZ
MQRGVPLKVYLSLVFGVPGVFFVGWMIHYFGSAPVMPVPENWVRYQCPSPPLLIEFQAAAAGLRLTSHHGVVRTRVNPRDGQINWKNFQAAGVALGLQPPVKIVSASATLLVVDGGAFENAECAVVGK